MASPYTTAGCETTSQSGVGLTVWVNETCYQRLVPPDDVQYGAIPFQVSENEIELRDGSQSHPISLPGIQANANLSAATLLTQMPDGTFQAWKASLLSGKKKLVAYDGSFILEEDVHGDLFTDQMCSANCADLDGVIGYRDVTVRCEGQPDYNAVQIFKVPLCGVAEVPDPDIV